MILTRTLRSFIIIGALVLPTLAASGTVSFNTKNNKYHELSCKWAAKCTKSCVEISRDEAIKRGGIPCKVCHKR